MRRERLELLESALGRVRRNQGPLLVGDEARRVQWGAHQLDLTRYGSTRRVLWRLVQARREAPGTWLGKDQVFQAAWPGQRIRGDSATHRVHVAVSNLRKLGLDGLVQTLDGAYRLDPGVPVRLEGGAPARTPPGGAD